jgi:hypothetical protein
MSDDLQQVDSAAIIVRALTAPMSIDKDNRTVDVIWTTGKRAKNYVPGIGAITEELDLSAASVRMARLSSGNAPVFDSHRNGGARDQIGRVVSAKLESKRGIATLQFSSAPDVEPLWHRVMDGTIRSVSVGYTVRKYMPVNEGSETIHRAVDWEPLEISLAPIPVDDGAIMRAIDDGASQFVATETADFAVDDAPALAERKVPMSITAAPAASQEQTMTENVTPAAPGSDAVVVDIQAERASAVNAERARIAAVDGVLANASRLLPEAVRAELRAQAINDGMMPEAVRAMAFDRLAAMTQAGATVPTQTAHVGRSGDDPAALIDAMGTALAVQSMPAMARNLKDDRWREFAALKPSDMMMELLAARGEHVSPRQRGQFVERAFHTSSDFPMLLENAGNKMLEAGFVAAAPSYRQFFGQRSFNDFKAHTFLTAGDFPAPQELGEGGEIKGGTISEKRERITPKTYARSVGVTRQMLVNDDLGAFSDFGAMIGRRIADYENFLAYSMVETATGNGPTLLEGSAAVFTTGRGNKASSGATISETTLDAGYAGIQNATSLDGIKLNLQPRYLLTGTAYRGAALRYTTRISADSGANVGLYSDLIPISDANITGNRWYMFADPAAAPIYVYGYVNGQTAPQIRVHQYVPGTDGIKVEVVHDFAVGAIGFRGGWFNPGA